MNKEKAYNFANHGKSDLNGRAPMRFSEVSWIILYLKFKASVRGCIGQETAK